MNCLVCFGKFLLLKGEHLLSWTARCNDISRRIVIIYVFLDKRNSNIQISIMSKMIVINCLWSVQKQRQSFYIANQLFKGTLSYTKRAD